MKQFSGPQIRELVLDNREAAKILIVDDDAYFRELVRRLMTASGYEVMEARSTNEAESLLRFNPALAIIDYRLPNTDGAAWIRTLRERGVKFPIVFCSGSSYSPQTLANVRNVLHVELIVRKPIQPNEFVRQLESLMPIRSDAGKRHDTVNQRSMVEIQLGASAALARIKNAVNTERVLNLPGVVPTSEAIGCTISYPTPAPDNEYKQPLISDILDSLIAEDEVKKSDQAITLDHIPLAKIYAHREASRAEMSPVQDMRPQQLKQSGISLEEDEEETRVALEELAILYLSELPATFNQIKDEVKAAQQNGDIWGLQSAADRSHQLRGTAGSLGFNRLSLVAGELEDCLREEVGNDLACPLFNSIAINSLIEQLETLINGDQELDIENESEKPHDFLLSNKRALLIDSDQEENDIFCTEMNDLQDWRTIGLTDCSTIFAVLDKYQPTLLFLRSELAETTGFELCRLIRCHPNWEELPIVVITRDCSHQTRKAIFDCGATDYLPTPIIPTELQMKLHSISYAANLDHR